MSNAKLISGYKQSQSGLTSVSVSISVCPGVEFGARMITIDGKQIKLQIWDTVMYLLLSLYINI